MKYTVLALLLAVSGTAFAQSVTTGTQSTAQQQSNVQNTVNLPASDGVRYSGDYTVKSAPTVYAPSLTASVTETCWGSVSGSVSVVGVGVAGGATIKDLDCNRRLNAGVAWRMDRHDIAFNIMCQDDSFRDAAAMTDKPCGIVGALKAANTAPPANVLTAAVIDKPQEPRDPFVRSRMGLPALPPSVPK